MKACIDSDVLIDYFDGVEAAAKEFSKYSALVISRITWMEALIGADGEEQQRIRESFMRSLGIVELDEAIGRSAISLRKEHRLKLPDAIIWATSLNAGAMLLTRKTKDFPRGERSIRFPYRV